MDKNPLIQEHPYAKEVALRKATDWLDLQRVIREVTAKYALTGFDERLLELCVEKAYEFGRRSYAGDFHEAGRKTLRNVDILYVHLRKVMSEEDMKNMLSEMEKGEEFRQLPPAKAD